MPTRDDQWLRRDTERGVAVLRLVLPELHGDEASEGLCKELCDAVADLSVPNAVLDCRDVTFVTSLGIAALLRFRNRCKKAGGRVVLSGLGPLVKEVFETTKVGSTDPEVDAPFLITADVPSAVAWLAPPP
jgi:anti-anti-sigma factor